MKKKMLMSLVVGILTLATSINVFAAPKQMPDGNMFDAEYYATSNPDVAAVLGVDENLLYSHYINCGILEGRKGLAQEVVMPEFDAVYYATNNPDVAAVLGTDENLLYSHYLNSGKMEGRIPCENGVPFMEVAPPSTVQVPIQPEIPMQQEVVQKKTTNSSGVIVPDHEEAGANTVWVPVNGGTKYHKGPGCSNMDEPMQVTVETAIEHGYTPCKRCYKY